ncbi:hypothetical protein V8C86DRAFT_1711912 [Haematococcus lacustris]
MLLGGLLRHPQRLMAWPILHVLATSALGWQCHLDSALSPFPHHFPARCLPCTTSYPVAHPETWSQTGQRLQRLSLAREQAEQGGAAQLLGVLLARCWRNLLQHVALHRASWAWQQLLVGPQDPRALPASLLTGARLAGEEGRGSNDGGQGFVSRTQEQQQQERHLSALGESVVSSQAQPRGQLGDTSPKDQGVSVRLPSSFAQPRSSQQTAQGLCLGGWGPGLLPGQPRERRQGPTQPQCTREPDAESRACCKAQCLAKQAGMAVQLAELTMQLDSCQVGQGCQSIRQ